MRELVRSSISIGKIDQCQEVNSCQRTHDAGDGGVSVSSRDVLAESKTPLLWDSPGARKLRAQPGLKFVARSGGSSGAYVPLSPFVPRPFVGSFVGFVRSLRSRSAPVVEVDAKVGVLSREKGVSRAPVSPPSSPGSPSDPEFPPRAHALPAARGWRSRVVRSRPALFASEHVGLNARFKEDKIESKFVPEEEGEREEGGPPNVPVSESARYLSVAASARRLSIAECI